MMASRRMTYKLATVRGAGATEASLRLSVRARPKHATVSIEDATVSIEDATVSIEDATVSIEDATVSARLVWAGATNACDL
jgi:hypothetical protein